MDAVKYFCGTTELRGVYGEKKQRFLAIGGVPNKHNWYDSFSRFVGHPATGSDAVMPVERKIYFKTNNPSLHKCDARCRHAKGHNCECSCGGQFHGAGN